MTRPRILITRRWPERVVAAMGDRYEVAHNHADVPLPPDELARAMCSFDVICPTITDRLGPALFDQPDLRVRLIANFGVGFEHVDRAAAMAAAVVVTNTPDVLTQATAELAILLMAMVARRAGEGERQLRAGEWHGWHPTQLMGTSLASRRLGLVGFGRIGQETARMARALWGLDIAWFGRRPAKVAGARFVADLGELLETSDVVSLHCPGGEATRHMIDAAALARMKSTAILVNTARGSVVDEAALADALRDGVIAGAGLDVYEREPQVEPRLLGLENAVLLPHLGSATLETREAMGMRVLANIDTFFGGGKPRDRVC